MEYINSNDVKIWPSLAFALFLPLPQSAPAPSPDDLTSHVGATDASTLHSSSTSPTTASIASDMREINRPKTGSNVSKMKVGTITRLHTRSSLVTRLLFSRGGFVHPSVRPSLTVMVKTHIYAFAPQFVALL